MHKESLRSRGAGPRLDSQLELGTGKLGNGKEKTPRRYANREMRGYGQDILQPSALKATRPRQP